MLQMGASKIADTSVVLKNLPILQRNLYTYLIAKSLV